MFRKWCCLLLAVMILCCLVACAMGNTTTGVGDGTTAGNSTTAPNGDTETKDDSLFTSEQRGCYSMHWTEDEDVLNILRLTINDDDTVTFEDPAQQWSATNAVVVKHDDGTFSFTYQETVTVDRSEFPNEQYDPWGEVDGTVDKTADFYFQNGLIYLNADGTEFPIIKATKGLSFDETYYLSEDGLGNCFYMELYSDGTIWYEVYLAESEEGAEDSYEIYDECEVCLYHDVYYFIYEDLNYGCSVVASFVFNDDGTITLYDDLVESAIILEECEGFFDDGGFGDGDYDDFEDWEPEVNVPYVLAFGREELNAFWYLAGGKASALASTTGVDQALDVYLEKTGNGYYLYCYMETTKTYINMVTDGMAVNCVCQATADTVYTYDAENFMIVAVINNSTYTFGTGTNQTTVEAVEIGKHSSFWADLYERQWLEYDD